MRDATGKAPIDPGQATNVPNVYNLRPAVFFPQANLATHVAKLGGRLSSKALPSHGNADRLPKCKALHSVIVFEIPGRLAQG